MKKIVYILGVIAASAGLCGCQDWLDMPSESQSDSQSVFSTVGRAEMAILAAYQPLHTQELGYQFLMGTDETAACETNSKFDIANYNYTNTSSILSGTYTSMYKAIEYANVCIANLPQMSVSESEQAKVDMLLGEALAIRAYAYWNIVRFYGDIPYSDVPTSQLTSFASSRVDRDYIYDRCIEDLQQAVELLPWYSEGNILTPERFSKNAAYGILARVALYAAGESLRWDLSTVPYNAGTLHIGNRDGEHKTDLKFTCAQLYQIAADACKAVITKGENTLVGDYDKLFRDIANSRYNSESMFEFGWYGPSSPDVRTGYTNGIPGSGACNVFGKFGTQMTSMPTLYFEYDEGDQRRDVSVCNYSIEPNGSTEDTHRLNTYLGMGVGKYRINWMATKGTSDSRRDINWPLLRYADVLLMYAEALNEINHGATGEATDAVRQVRLRAFRNDSGKIGTIPTGYEDFKNFIIQERKLELAHEGLRKSDLLRWGILYEHLTAEKAKLVSMAKHEGAYANIPTYWAYQLNTKAVFEDPMIGLDYIPMTEEQVAAMLTADELKKIHITNTSTDGYADVKLKVDGSSVTRADDGEAYRIVNMFGSFTNKNPRGTNKGLSVEAVEGVSSNNEWITGNNGVYYGLKKNMVEIMPFHQTSIIDVNPGLAGQQHPAY